MAREGHREVHKRAMDRGAQRRRHTSRANGIIRTAQRKLGQRKKVGGHITEQPDPYMRGQRVIPIHTT